MSKKKNKCTSLIRTMIIFITSPHLSQIKISSPIPNKKGIPINQYTYLNDADVRSKHPTHSRSPSLISIHSPSQLVHDWTLWVLLCATISCRANLTYANDFHLVNVVADAATSTSHSKLFKSSVGSRTTRWKRLL